MLIYPLAGLSLIFWWIFVPAEGLTADYPNKPIRFVVALSPGGPSDIVARLVGKQLSQNTGQPVVVDNRPGASTIIGTEIVARAPADGYTILMISTTHAVNPSFLTLPYDPVKDFAPVTMTNSAPYMLVVHPSLPVSTAGQLVSLARKKPGQLNFASAGHGGAPHLTAELFKAAAGIDIVHVPYKGIGPAFADLLAGHVQMLFSATLTSLPYVRSGRLRGIAVASLTRVAAAPSLPTFAESGFPGFESSSWNGVMVPSRTPPQIIERLYQEIAAALKASEVRDYFVREGVIPGGNSPEEFGRFFRSEISRWGAVIKNAGIRMD